MRMIHVCLWALAISVLFMRSLITLKLGVNVKAGYLYGMRVLGVVLSANITMGNHMDEILSSASSIYALCMLRSHGLGSPQLHVIARSTTLASMLYASPSWWGFTSAWDKDRLEKLIGWQRRGGFLPDVVSFADLAHLQPKSC